MVFYTLLLFIFIYKVAMLIALNLFRGSNDTAVNVKQGRRNISEKVSCPR